VNIRNISYVDISVSDHTGTDGLNWFSAIGPDLSGLPLWSEHAETTFLPLSTILHHSLQPVRAPVSPPCVRATHTAISVVTSQVHHPA